MFSITVAEASAKLGVSPARVRQLIKSGVLAAEQVAGIWLIDEKSVEARREHNPGRGRPSARLSQPNISRYLLMNRDHEVLAFRFDASTGEFLDAELIGMQVYEDLDEYIVSCGYDVRCFGYDPYNAKEFVERWAAENGPFGIEKVIQGAKTESVPLGELKKLAEDRMLLFDEELMTYAMGNCIAMEDTNGNRKLMKKRYEQKIDAVSAMMDAYIAYKRNPEAFE